MMITPAEARALERLVEEGSLHMGPQLDLDVVASLARKRLVTVGRRQLVTITELGREVIR